MRKLLFIAIALLGSFTMAAQSFYSVDQLKGSLPIAVQGMGELTEVEPPAGALTLKFYLPGMSQEDFSKFKDQADLVKYGMFFGLSTKGPTVYSVIEMAFNAGLGLNLNLFTDLEPDGFTISLTNGDLKALMTCNRVYIIEYIQSTYGFTDWKKVLG